MDSLPFAEGPQMGNKMFVQLFNVKNIYFGAQILCPVWVRLSRLCLRGWLEERKWLFSEGSATRTAESGHGLL